MKYTSKIRLQKPSSKAIYVPAKLSTEFIEHNLDKIHEIFLQSGAIWEPSLIDVETIKKAINETVESDSLLSNLCNSEIGTGYLLGATLTSIFAEAFEDEETD